MITIDTETTGFAGPAVLIQYAYDDGPVELFSPWTNPIKDTLKLITEFCNHPGGIVGFNICYDWFHLCKLYTMFDLYPDKEAIPEEIIEELALLEPLARDGPCLKPVKACDVMLVARKTTYQSTMDRSDIRIRRTPTSLAWQLASELENRIKFKDIYFARKKDKHAQRWQIYDIIDDDGEIDPNFKDIVLKFAPSSALKALAVDTGIADEVTLFGEIGVNEAWYPNELGYAPFALAIGSKADWKGTWPEKIQHHINHWQYHKTAREYGAKDVEYTRALYKYFGSPPLGDDDSELACCIAACRWRGFKIDASKLRKQREEALLKIKDIPTAPAQVRWYIYEKLDETEKLVIKNSTKKILLESIAKLTQPCPHCNKNADVAFTMQEVNPDMIVDFGNREQLLHTTITPSNAQCDICKNTGIVKHPGAERAQQVLDARAAVKEIENYDKLLLAGRFHASFKVIGALSSRMSGSDGLNAQGIKKTKEVRSCFPLAWDDQILVGGDYTGFEVTLAEACYNDPVLRRDLLTCERCDGEMQRINNRIAAKDFLNEFALNEYINWRLKVEQKAHTKDGKYRPKPEYEIREESFENDFICKECGSNEGKAIHALFGVNVYPEHTYHSLKATKGTNDDKYTRAKSAVFAMFYGGEGPTLKERLGVDLETANKAFELFGRKYRGVTIARQRIIDAFQSMKQIGGIGTKVEWHEPKDFIESMFGFRRYFTLENRICKALFDLAEKPPKSWKDIKIKVMRRDREQTASGAVQSSLFAAAFNLQASNMRAAANHEIQSSGATCTKHLQRRIWDLQPTGINDWKLMVMNIHDELMTPCLPEMAEIIKNRVNETVESFRSKVPLIKMDWASNLKTWADK